MSKTRGRERSRRGQRRRSKQTTLVSRLHKWRYGALGLVALVLVVVVAIAWQQLTAQEGDEEALWETITETEHAFLRFGEELSPKLQVLPNEELRNQLLLPFELAKINQENPYRNYLYFQRVASEVVDESGRFQQENLNFFFYGRRGDVEGSISEFAAAFAPTMRLMILDQKHDSLVDLLVLHHELRHAMQDIKERGNIQTEEEFDQYIAFHTDGERGRPRLILNWETTAYAYELELLNIMLGDQLRESVLRGHVLKSSVIAERLNAQPDDMTSINFLRKLADLYYPQGFSGEGFDPRYVRFLGQVYYDRGYRLYSTNGGFKNAVEISPGDF